MSAHMQSIRIRDVLFLLSFCVYFGLFRLQIVKNDGGPFLISNLYEFKKEYAHIHQSLLTHRLVDNGEFSNFELFSLVRNSIYVAQILCGLK